MDVGAIESYGSPGSGGLQPVAYAGAAPYRRARSANEPRRPVVATLDTGCGPHSWLDGIVDTTVRLDGAPIGHVDPTTDPELDGDQVGAMDGALDEVSGHGTFIAGLIHQACPEADIVAWRCVDSDGVIVESELVAALTAIAVLVSRAASGLPGGLGIDVFSLSMGYYHETPEDGLFDPTMYELLASMGRCGTVVTCSAGNDATDRPMFPAAFAPWQGGGGPVKLSADVTAIVSVRALNPNGSTVALFSNDGPWIGCSAPGGAVFSTMPAFNGGDQPLARVGSDLGGSIRVRESIDPDDFRGGFAVWSGTSFAAPIVAGAIASALDAASLQPFGSGSLADRVKASSVALQKVTAVAP